MPKLLLYQIYVDQEKILSWQGYCGRQQDAYNRDFVFRPRLYRQRPLRFIIFVRARWMVPKQGYILDTSWRKQENYSQ